MLSRSHDDHPPSVTIAGAVITWHLRSYELVVGLVQKAQRAFEAMRKGLADERIHVWHAPPGIDTAEATPIALESEFLQRTYPDGAYFLRILYESGEAHYFQCRAVAAAPAAETQSGARTMETVLSRSLDTSEALSRIRSTELEDALKSLRKARQEADDLRAESEEKSRTIRRLEAERDQAIEDGEPLFDDETSLKVLALVEQWALSDDQGIAGKHLGVLFSGVVKLLADLEQDAAIMARIVGAHSPAWTQFRAAFNQVSEGVKQDARLQPAASIAKLPAIRRLLPKAPSAPSSRAAPAKKAAARRAG